MKKNDFFLSIIIPVYNVEKYLNRCLDSIINQNVNFRYEIILVNDCSTDSSLSILIDYKNKYDNITIVNHIINKKLSVARKSGIEISKGNYVMHVDSDDWIIDNSLQSIYNILVDSLADIIVFNYYTENTNSVRKFVNIIDKGYFTDEKKGIQNFFLGAPWNKVVRRELLDNLIFGSVGINNGEDLVYSTELYLKAKNIFLTNYSFYIYFDNLTSLTKVNNTIGFLTNQQIVLIELFKIFNKYKVEPSIINFVINYFLSFIYKEIFKFNFKLDSSGKMQVLDILNSIAQNNLLSEKDKLVLNHSINSKLFSLIQMVKVFGIKKTIGLLI